MAVTTYYTLKIGGRLGVPYTQDSAIEKDWRALFGDKPSNAGKPHVSSQAEKAFDPDWPDGFLRPNGEAPRPRPLQGGAAAFKLGGEWEVHEWKATAEPVADGMQTKLTFEAEVEFEGNGGIDDHRASQKIAAEWFFDYFSKRWHETLRARLAKFNADYKAQLIEPAGFREWEFYCGNGGGGGE